MAIASFIIAMAVLAYAIHRKGSMLDSVSEVAYIIPSWMFTVWIAIVGIFLAPCLIDSLPLGLKWVGFLAIVGLFAVAASPYYKTDSKTLHYSGGIICFIFSTITTAIVSPLLLLLWFGIFPLIIYCAKKRWLLYCELACFSILILTVI